MMPFTFAIGTMRLYQEGDSIRSWCIAKELLDVFEAVPTLDLTIPHPGSLDDYPGAVGFLYNRPVYLLDEALAASILITAHCLGQTGCLDHGNRISWNWSN